MGHLSGKDIFRNLATKIDNRETRTPLNATLYAILNELYTPEEAEVVIRMPNVLSSFDEVAKATGYDKTVLRKILDSLCEKGLVMDFWINEEYKYTYSVILIGFFEFTVMRRGNNLNTKEWARLFHEYMHGDATFMKANFGNNERVSFFRALPYEESIDKSEYIEVLDYEKASAIIQDASKLAIGTCACRHTRSHLGEKSCNTPLETCSALGLGADFFIRNSLGREVSRSEMEENFARSKAMGLVFTVDNVRKNVKFACHCCKCCCYLLSGMRKYGYPNIIITSNYLPSIDEGSCTGCGRCLAACPIEAIKMISEQGPGTLRKQRPTIDTTICLGCGVCAFQCPAKACKLVKHDKRVIRPETTFERIILQCLEKGTLQDQMFDNPQNVSHKFMRAFMGGFFRLAPVKKALLSDTLRSSFLRTMKTGAKKNGQAWALDL